MPLGWAPSWQEDGALLDRRRWGRESGLESGKWSFLARIEREGRALSLHQHPVRNPCAFGPGGWAGTE